MKKKIIWLIGIILVIVVILLVTGKSQNNQTIKVGFITPLSGDAAAYGDVEKNITQYLSDELNAKGGVNGQKIEFIYEDGKCNPKDATNAAQKLVNVDGVKIIFGGLCSSETLAIAAITEPRGVLLFNAFSSSPDVTTAGDYVFRVAPSDLESGSEDAEYVIKKGFKKIAIMTEKTAYSIGLKKVFVDKLNAAGVQIVYDEDFNSDVNDFKTFFAKIKSTDADLVYLNAGTSGKVAGLLVRQAKDAGITAELHGNFFMSGDDAIKSAGPAIEGIIFSDATGFTEKGSFLKDLYKEKFGKDIPHEYGAGAAYDRFNIFVAAVDEVGSDPKEIKEWLYDMKPYEGTVGTYNFDKNGDVNGVGWGMFTIKNGKKEAYTY